MRRLSNRLRRHASNFVLVFLVLIFHQHEAEEILRQRQLGFSFVRLLPKETGVRPIVNLRRRTNPKVRPPKTNRGICLAHSHMGSARKAGAFDQSNSEDDVCYSKLRKGISLCSMSESAHTDVLRSKNNRTSLERLSLVPMRYTKS